MAKYSGMIGYVFNNDNGSGVYSESVTEKKHYGDILKNTVSYKTNDFTSTIDDVTISNRLSILATPFSIKNFQYMKYATILGIKWKITNVDIQYPRLILTLGGLYNA